MHPILFEFGPLKLYTYGLLVALGFAAGLWVGTREARRYGVDPKRFQDLAFAILLSAVAGARLFFVVLEWLKGAIALALKESPAEASAPPPAEPSQIPSEADESRPEGEQASAAPAVPATTDTGSPARERRMSRPRKRTSRRSCAGS